MIRYKVKINTDKIEITVPNMTKALERMVQFVPIRDNESGEAIEVTALSITEIERLNKKEASSCEYCGTVTLARLCNRCQDLEHRILINPHVAQKIINGMQDLS